MDVFYRTNFYQNNMNFDGYQSTSLYCILLVFLEMGDTIYSLAPYWWSIDFCVLQKLFCFFIKNNLQFESWYNHMVNMCSCLCAVKWMGGSVCGRPAQICMPISNSLYIHICVCMCVCGDVAPGLLWSSPCLISMSIDSICFAHERARMCRRTGERKEEECGGELGEGCIFISTL